jgi:hypothetical protein
MAGVAVEMVRPYVREYLQKKDQEIDQELLHAMARRFVSVTIRQFMEKKEQQAGRFHASSGTKCVRQSWLKYLGFFGPPMDMEVLLKFWYGDLIELGVYGLIQMAFEGSPHSIGFNNERVEVPIGKKHHGVLNGYPDGMLHFYHLYHKGRFGQLLKPSWVEDEEYMGVEFKSMGDYPFKKFEEDGPDDTWGYQGQASLYQRAVQVKRWLFVAVHRDKGLISERLLVRNKDKELEADTNYDTVMEAVENKTEVPMPAGKDYKMSARNDGSYEIGLVCRFCQVKEECFARMGYGLEARQVKTRNGFMEVFDARKTGARQQSLYDDVSRAVGETGRRR